MNSLKMVDSLQSEFHSPEELETLYKAECLRISKIVMVLLDQKGSILYANPNFFDQFGISPSDLVNTKFSDFFTADPDFESDFMSGIQSLQSQERISFEISIQKATQNFSAKISSLKDKKNVFSCLIEAHVQINNRIDDKIPTQAYLEKILENTHAVLWLKALPSLEMLYVSDNFHKLYGFSKEAFFKDHSLFYNCLHPDDREKLALKPSYQPSDQFEEVGFRFKKPDGNWHHATTYRFLLFDDKGFPNQIAGVTIDDTKLFNAYKEIQNQKEILNQKNQELFLSYKNFEELTHIAYHDLSLPLRVINAHLQLIEKDYLKNQDDNCKKFLNSIYQSIYRMKDLIDSIARITKSSILDPHQQKIVCVRNVIENTIKPLFLTVINRNLIIKTGTLNFLYLHQSDLITILKNLIENTIKYNKNERPQVYIRSRKIKSGVLYAISDNGIGIPQPQLKTIFSFGERAENAFISEGSGIGLAACHRIMETYEGKIWVRSQLGQGSTFYLYFPIPPHLGSQE
ncbi:HisKA, HATPase and PAS domain-containing protein [Candidatus Bealeia paramacronuclearis]|uniref:histidine kinase n=1 Tax=Candidatus Bealeia paramacronuclearis TaxID=1921001 RepID=A0ABZ2C4C4_9PROT|nr:HisKA, HATPase and PAS domain-containing protein [Candidatus Bealeia paramacronuclearis]